eukprot:TRINITY_DN3_c0_g2_i1.p1 TRINITY_DN3_c0_g2~~TRINITY_DN3_c0_g2_i1.p1  ORF type:complete len:2720 (-),score=773.78 TRINITY_DN3_c0_g2_i1:178-8337(-)
MERLQRAQVVVLSMLALLCVCAANTITVNTADDMVNADGSCSLREAIAVAEGATNPGCAAGNPDPNVVDEIVVAGSVTSISVSSVLTIEYDVRITAPSGCTLDGGTTQRIMEIVQTTPVADRITPHVTIEGFTFSNGFVSTSSGGVAGGLTNQGVTHLIDVDFEENRLVVPPGSEVPDGAAAAIHNTGTLIITGEDISFANNYASSNNELSDPFGLPIAGGIFSSGALDITGATFMSNTAGETLPGATPSLGIAACAGAIFARAVGGPEVGSVSVHSSVFTDNTGCIGGAIAAHGAVVRLDDVTFRGNEADFHGGAIFSTLDVQWLGGGVVSGNIAVTEGGIGGVVASSAGSVFIEGVESFEGNNAALQGGVVYAHRSAEFRNVSGGFHSNVAGFYGGVAYTGSRSLFEYVGDFYMNYASVSGSVARARDDIGIYHAGNIYYHSGGNTMLESFGTVSLEYVGSIRNNQASEAIIFGGNVAMYDVAEIYYEESDGYVAYASGSLRIDTIGRIADCHGGYSVLYATSGPVRVENVAGNIEYNTGGHGLLHTFGSAGITLRNVQGSISYNVDDQMSVMLAVNGPCEISYVGGDIRGNRFEVDATGVRGVVATCDGVTVRHVTGGIIDNYCYDNGGAFYSSGPVLIEDVGSIAENESFAGPGVVASYGSVVMRRITDITSNRGDRGGVVYIYGSDASVLIDDVYNDITDNYSGPGGGVVRAHHSHVKINNVHGDVSYNGGEGSGVVVGAVVEITNIGSIRYNECGGVDGGGVVNASDSAYIAHVPGGLLSNSAFYFGGVVFVRNAGGRPTSVHLYDVGAIYYNTAGLAGGVVYSEGGGTVTISRVDGDISYNEAAGLSGGALVYALPSSPFPAIVTIEYVDGDIVSNEGRYLVAISGTGKVRVEHTGEIRGNTCFYLLYASPDPTDMYLRNTGTIADNSGIAYTEQGNIDLYQVYSIEGNSSYNDGDYASGVHAPNGNVRIQHVPGGITGQDNRSTAASALATASGEVLLAYTGDITYNESPNRVRGGVLSGEFVAVLQVGAIMFNSVGYSNRATGGFADATTTAIIDGVAGDVAYNEAANGGSPPGVYGGGVVAAVRVVLRGVSGSIYENSALYGGVALANNNSNTASLVIEDIGGSIHSNVATQGGVAYVYGAAHVKNVRGAIADNMAIGGVTSDYDGCGGAVLATAGLTVYDVSDVAGNFAFTSGGALAVFGSEPLVVYNVGAVLDNTASNGGAFYAESDVYVSNVGSSIEYGYHYYGYLASGSNGYLAIGRNISILNGGAIYSLGHVSLRYVNGDIGLNMAGGVGGGVISGGNGVDLSDVLGSVFANEGASGGGVILTGGGVDVLRVSGSISYNTTAGFGGVVYCEDDAYIAHVGGDISYNRSGTSGGVVARLVGSMGNVEIVDVRGSIEQNACSTGLGGVVRNVVGTAVIKHVYGDISDNVAASGGGGVLATSNGYTRIENVGGEIARNYALVVGGVVFGENLQVDIVSTGDIIGNSAQAGGVVYIQSSPSFGVEMRNVRSIQGNYSTGSGISAYGAVYCGQGGVSSLDLVISDVPYGISYNYPASYAFIASGGATFTDVGDITYNEGSWLAYSEGYMNLQRVGAISDNSFEESLFKSYAGITVLGTGDITNNSAFGGSIFDVYFPSFPRTLTLNDIGMVAYNEGRVGLVNSGLLTVSNAGGFVENGYDSPGALALYSGDMFVSGVAGPIAYHYNGFAYSPDGSVVIEHVYGDISYNGLEGEQVGVAYASNAAAVRHVGGSITGNAALEGAVVCGRYVDVAHVQGDVSGNTAEYGGVGYGLFSSSVRHVSGSVSYNTASGSSGPARGFTGRGLGGVLYSAAGTSIENVATLSYNSADIGGVSWAAWRGEMSDVGYVVGNSNSVMSCYAYCSIARVSGGLLYNTAEDNGGVAFSELFVSLVDVARADYNTSNGYGGVASAQLGDVFLSNVGSLSGNTAEYSGGAVYAFLTVHASSLGRVADNTASNGSGGFAYGGEYVFVQAAEVFENNTAGVHGGVAAGTYALLSGVGSALGNTASEYGGVAYGEIAATLQNPSLRVCDNEASRGGVVAGGQYATVASDLELAPAIVNNSGDPSVAYGHFAALVDAGSGVIAGNSEPVADAQAPNAAVRVQAAVNAQGGAAMEVVQQPGDGVERVVLHQQPWVAVEGAEGERVLAIHVELVEEGSGETTQEWEIEDLEVEFGNVVRVRNLEVEERGTYTLVFSLEVPTCDTDSGNTTVLVSAETEPFEIFECFSPSPAVCPQSVVQLVNDAGECSARANLTQPTTEQCSEFELDSSEDREGPFEVGTTRFVWTLSNEAGAEDRCVVDVVVADREPPRINCTDVTVAADAGQCSAVVDVPLPDIIDNCDELVTISSSHRSPVFAVGRTEVEFTAVDAGGNVGTCVSVVVVEDTQPPEIVCPAVRGERKCDARAEFAFPQAVDNCAGAAVRQLEGVGEGEPLNPGVTFFRFVAEDAAGLNATCEFSVTTNSTWYFDGDSDGVGGGAPVFGCPSPGVGWVQDKGGDCDDTRASLGLTVFVDLDEDTWGSITNKECVEYDFFDVPVPDPSDDERRRHLQRRSSDGVLFVLRTGDCDDSNAFINPEAREVCNGVDDNCNGLIDEGITCTGIQIIVSESTTTYPMPSIPRAPIAPPAPIIEVSLPTPLPTLPTPAVTSEGSEFTDKRFTALIAFRSSTRSAGALLHAPLLAALVFAFFSALFLC